MKPFLYLSGLKKMAKKLKGNERIHVGIRPYGFHAGNALSLFVYPFLLCKEMRKLGKEPRFHFFISINDYEQDELDGPDCKRYPFNIYPKNSSLQYTPDESGCCDTTVDHWQPIIQKIVGSLNKDYPRLKIEFIRNSSLKNTKYFKKLLIDTLKNPSGHAEIFSKYGGREVLESPIQYAGVICPRCKKSRGVTTVLSSTMINWDCATCGCNLLKPYEYYDYWWYHKAMLTARLRTFRIKVAMSGADHYSEGDYNIRLHFFRKYFKDFPEPIMLFCPVLTDRDGQKMSKSRHNTHFAKLGNLIRVAEVTEGDLINLTRDLIEVVKDEREYADIYAGKGRAIKGVVPLTERVN